MILKLSLRNPVVFQEVQEQLAKKLLAENTSNADEVAEVFMRLVNHLTATKYILVDLPFPEDATIEADVGPKLLPPPSDT